MRVAGCTVNGDEAEVGIEVAVEEETIQRWITGGRGGEGVRGDIGM